MLFPKKVKYRKWQRLRGQFKGVETRGTNLAFGASGIKALSSGQITSEQIEAARKVLTRYTAKRGELGKFRFDIGFGKNKNIKLGSNLRKDIARILTIINQKENERS